MIHPALIGPGSVDVSQDVPPARILSKQTEAPPIVLLLPLLLGSFQRRGLVYARVAGTPVRARLDVPSLLRTAPRLRRSRFTGRAAGRSSNPLRTAPSATGYGALIGIPLPASRRPGNDLRHSCRPLFSSSNARRRRLFP